MKRLVRLCLIFTVALTPAAPAFAEMPPAPKPVWWADQGYGDLRPGFWVPCLEGWSSVDCIESVSVRRADATEWRDLSFTPREGIEPSEIRQWWASGPNAATQPWEQDAWIRHNAWDYGVWSIPESVTTTGVRNVSVLVQLNRGNVHFSVMGPNWRTENLDPDMYYRVSLRTKELQRYMSFVYSNSHDATITIPDKEHVHISGRAAVRYDPKDDESFNACAPNSTAGSAPIGVEVMGMIRNNSPDDELLGEVVLGTNGWYCIEGLRFDEASQQLTVKVGTNHFDPNGKPIEGWVEVKVRGESVRRWWGVNPQLVAGSARVEVIYENGNTVIATTNASYDAKNDWIDLRSYGFRYSAPTLGIKVVKTSANADAPVAPKVIAKPATKKATITCTKGKQTKRFTAISPRCPAGWKKK